MLDSMQYWDDPVFELGASAGTWSPVSNEQEAFTMATGVPPHDHYTTLLDTDQDNALMNYFTEAFGEEEHDQNVNYIQHNSNGKSKPQRKMRKDLRRVNQRSAANQRERRRMKTINDAFEGLRDHIPLSSSERKLSKVDTLRLAIRYIQHLGKLLQSYDPLNRMMGMKRNREQTKVIIRCQQWGKDHISAICFVSITKYTIRPIITMA